MINRFLITICLALVAMVANAQTITDELRRTKNGYGKVTVNQSADIEALVNNTNQAKTTANTSATKVENVVNTPERVSTETTSKPAEPEAATKPADVEKPATAPKPNEAEKPAVAATAHTSATPTEAEGAAVNTNKKIMRNSYKTTGYRIQVYSGGNKREDRIKCEQISARLKASFPNLPIYVHFYSPSWKCRAGNYTDQGEASAMLKQIRAMGYTEACLVKGTINVQY